MERPREKGHGDYATNVAMQLAKKAGTNPRALGELLAGRAAAGRRRSRRRGRRARVPQHHRRGRRPGPGRGRHRRGRCGVRHQRQPGRGEGQRRVHLRQPHRPAPPRPHPLGGRRRRASAGCSRPPAPRSPASSTSTTAATRWTASAPRSRPGALGEPVPEDGYQGGYIADLAAADRRRPTPARDLPEEERRSPSGRPGTPSSCAEQQRAARRLPDRTSTSGSPSAASTTATTSSASIEKLRGQGHLYDADGALWMRTTDFGDDRDRVLIRTNGELTYFAADTAYYVNKRERGFDRCLYLLGADHHGYVGRLKAMAACAGDDPDAQHRGPDRPAGEDHARTARRSGSPSGPARSSRSRS